MKRMQNWTMLIILFVITSCGGHLSVDKPKTAAIDDQTVHNRVPASPENQASEEKNDIDAQIRRIQQQAAGRF